MNDRIENFLQDGYRLHQAGYVEEAEKLYRAVLREDGDNLHALNLLGMLCVNEFRPDEAIPLLMRAIKQAPRNPETHANIALAYKDQGKLQDAVRHFRESLRLNAHNPDTLNNLGNVLRELGEPRKAVPVYERALNMAPDFAQCWSNLSASLNECEHLDRALEAADRAIALDPEMAQGHSNRGDILLSKARYEEALEAYREATRLNPKYVAAMLNMGRTLRDMDRPEDAVSILQHALELEPRNPEAHHVLGVLQEQMGDRDKAAESFQSAIEVAPGMAIAHYYLAQLRGRETSADELGRMEDLWTREGMLENDRMFLAFALARVHEKRGDHDRAYHFIDQGNRIKASQQPYDDEDTGRFLDALVSSARAALDRLGPSPGLADDRPVFVLGMPRSGTSLTEQILASHEEIAGAGELSYAYDTAHRVRDLTGQKFPENLALLSAEQFRDLGSYYLSRHQEKNLAYRRLIDKTPLNFQYIGLLALALPRARFIHCHRDPVQNCFSIHKIPFDKKQAYAHDLQALGRYYSRYWSLMNQWKAMFPGRILDLRYEAVVADAEAESRRLLDFLGLEFQSRVLDFHKSDRLVKTPSASQVRQPIYSDALQSWRQYERQMGPLIENLAPELRPAQIAD